MENQPLEIRRPEDFQAEFAGLSIEARTVLDEQDYKRRVYDLGPNLSVTFRGRDELPTVGSSEFSDGRPSVVLTPDELPHVVDRAEFSEYVSTHPNTDSENKNLIVNATPVGIIDLVHRLSGEETMSSERSEMRANFLSGKIGDKENAILDMLATAFVGIEFGDPLAVSDGFMDVSLALAGNTEKRTEIHEKAIILSTQERGLVARELGEDALVLTYEHEPIDPGVLEKTKGLVLVRTIDHEPKISENGIVEVYPAAEITRDLHGTHSEAEENFIPRQTTHFTLNHFVRSHMEGNFENRGYVVVSPLSSALEAGQRPANLFGVDTWFTTGPGESVKLPDSKIIEAGTDQEDLVIDEGIKRTYKTAGFKLEDLSKIASECKDGIFKPLGMTFDSSGEEILNTLVLKDRVIEAGITTKLITTGTDAICYVGKSNIAELNYEQIVTEITKLNPEYLDKLMAQLLKNLLVDTTIIEQGGEVVTSDKRSLYITDIGFDSEVGKIAEGLHAKSRHHADYEVFERHFEEAAVVKLHGNRLNTTGRHEWQNANEAVGLDLNSSISSSNYSHRLRRAAIEAGLSTVRDEGDKKIREYKSEHGTGEFN